ncbi:MAG: hypothetical protein KG028_00835 [Actinobacteria bacterium]|nr:hypothetical protein [Actinomycetota bacterium]
MEPRDDFDRAGESLRERATRLTRGHDADEVVRLARRRRVWQGATAGVATIAVVVGILNGLPEPSVDRITVEPLAPSEAAPSEPPQPSTGSDDESTGDGDLSGSPACDVAETAAPPPITASLGTAAAAPPAAVAGGSLVAVDDQVLALAVEGSPAAALFGPGDGWRCLPTPELTDLRLAIGGGDRALVVGDDGAALLDPTTARWTALPLPDARPVGGVWTGHDFVVVLEAPAADAPSGVAAMDPDTGEWRDLAAAPFGVNRDYHTTVLWDGEQVLLLGNWLSTTNRASSLTARLAAYTPESDAWEYLPDSPLSPQAARAAMAGDRLVAVDYGQVFAEFDLDERVWELPVSKTGLAGSECPPDIAATDTQVVITSCWAGAVLDRVSGEWTDLRFDGDVREPVALDDGRIVHWHVADDGATALLVYEPDSAMTAAADVCADVRGFGTRLADTGIAPDEAAPATPADLADDVDLVVAGVLTGAAAAANGPGPAGESYLAFEFEVTETIKGDAGAGDTVRVSIAFDGDPARSAALTRDVPAGASVLVFAYEVTDAPGGWVAADGNGFAVACPGGPPLGQVGDGPGWPGMADLDALLDAAR